MPNQPASTPVTPAAIIAQYKPLSTASGTRPIIHPIWLIIAAGVTGVLAGWLGKWIPFYGNYVKILQPVGIVLLVLGVWLRGGYDTEMAWRAKVAEAEARVAAAEQKSQETNTVIEQKIVEKTKVIKCKNEYITKYIYK